MTDLTELREAWEAYKLTVIILRINPTRATAAAEDAAHHDLYLALVKAGGYPSETGTVDAVADMLGEPRIDWQTGYEAAGDLD